MMKFLRNREALFMIPELPSVEDRYNTYSSSFTAGASPTKPLTRKTAKKIKKNIHTVHTSLANALSIVDSRQRNLFPDVSENNNKTCPLFCEQNSVATASTADLTDDENDIYSKESSSSEGDSDEYTEDKKEKPGAALLVQKAPLLKGSRRWGEQNPLLGQCDDQHYLYANVRRLRGDSPPVCPVRWKE
jgi:hypothetical protein